MSQQPQTARLRAHRLAAGLLAWNAQLLGEDLDADFAARQRDALLADRHGGLRGAAVLRERPRRRQPTEPTTVPIGLAGFGGDFSGIRRFAERDHKNIVRWTMFDRGGHFAAHKAPEQLIGDIRGFYGAWPCQFQRIAELRPQTDRDDGDLVVGRRRRDIRDTRPHAPRR